MKLKNRIMNIKNHRIIKLRKYIYHIKKKNPLIINTNKIIIMNKNIYIKNYKTNNKIIKKQSINLKKTKNPLNNNFKIIL